MGMICIELCMKYKCVVCGLKHLRCLLEQCYFDQCAATLEIECNAADTGHDTPPRHSILTHQLMWNITMKVTTTHFNALCMTYHTRCKRSTTMLSLHALIKNLDRMVESVRYPPRREPRSVVY